MKECGRLEMRKIFAKTGKSSVFRKREMTIWPSSSFQYRHILKTIDTDYIKLTVPIHATLFCFSILYYFNLISNINSVFYFILLITSFYVQQRNSLFTCSICLRDSKHFSNHSIIAQLLIKLYVKKYTRRDKRKSFNLTWLHFAWLSARSLQNKQNDLRPRTPESRVIKREF